MSGEKHIWVDVVFPHPPLRRLTYRIPPHLEGIRPGHRVLVELGRRRVTGFVAGFCAKPDIPEPKEILDMMDPEPVLSEELFELTQWISQYYIASLGDVIRTALPPGIHQRSRLMVRRNAEALPPDLSASQRRLFERITADRWCPVSSLERDRRESIRYLLNRWHARGLVSLETVLEKARTHPRTETWIHLIQSPQPETLASMESRAPCQARIMRMLIQENRPVPRSSIPAALSVLRCLEEKNWIRLEQREMVRDPYAGVQGEKALVEELTDEQKRVIETVEPALEQGIFQPFLIHGVTGSGKTQIYIECIRRVLARSQSALVLIPEISLTPQAVQRYKGAFGRNVAMLHSRMSHGERFDAWRRIQRGEARIAVGPRSAVFAPLSGLGLIVVDEEHDSSYKQIDPSPRYHARDVAVMRAKVNRCPVLLGSATPSLESYHNAVKGKYRLCRLSRRIDDIPMPRVSLIDQRDRGKESILSLELKEQIDACLEQKGQVILLQNRRGYASLLRCAACGRIEQCPHCDISLTYHRTQRRLLCHYCGFERPAPDQCSVCGGATLTYRGVGTQRVEEALAQTFPGVRVLRMDQDTTRRKGAHDRILHRFQSGDGDILLGTQMVAKGHDFPNVRLVGIISADTGLHFPDFRAGEKTFQLLTQAAGRAGRRDRSGEVCIQTFSPDHPVLRLAARQDYDGFYQWESEARKPLNYPPWGRLAVILFRGKDENRVQKASETMAGLIAPYKGLDVLGPAPSPLSRIREMYRYQMILRTSMDDPAGKKMRSLLRFVFNRYWEQKGFPGVRVSVDIDPQDLL
ncbi:MAG TPA: primosomal protein N' [bacterium]|nr:primosomal protein N' [bacterium]